MRNRILLAGALIAGLVVIAAAGQGRSDLGAERARSPLSGVRDADPVHGSFWAPAGSSAVRPRPNLEPRVWSPRGRLRS